MISLVKLLVFGTLTSFANSGLSIQDAWVAEPPPGAKALAGYVIINNSLTTKIQIQSISSPGFKEVSFHATEVIDGVAKMKHLEVVNVPPRGGVAFAPGGNHLMLYGPKKIYKNGDRISFLLKTRKNGDFPFSAVVRHR